MSSDRLPIRPESLRWLRADLWNYLELHAKMGRLNMSVQLGVLSWQEESVLIYNRHRAQGSTLHLLQADEDGRLKCYHLEVVVDMPPAKVQALPPDAVIVKFSEAGPAAAAAAPDQASQGGNSAGDEPPEHFLELRVTGQVA